MNFKSPARILKVVMTHSLDGTSRETRLDLPTRKAIKKIEFTPEFMGAGEYKIEWRALGTDGHVIKGDFSFEVSG
ncbi:hypothetical protein SU32_02790 [Ahrensia marina]|uniref:CopC domain-containing protein n=2 Tax=Ahrensia marina TaxID=1514904 RepID=A0A0M9GPC4_9HYPH|nr:hypothetical protein SU32_02790 [Ahrensia marina]